MNVRKKHWKKRRGREEKNKCRFNSTARISFTRSHFCDGGPVDRHKESVSRLKIRGARRQVDVKRS